MNNTSKNRRNFLKTIGLGAAIITVSSLPGTGCNTTK